jgi:hypothetical protein
LRYFVREIMKKYIILGLLAGLSISAILVYLKKKKLEGTEFRELFDSSTVADDLFGDAFVELPDKP